MRVAVAMGVLVLALSAADWGRDPPRPEIGQAPDSALEEMRVGRFWHATRILREAGADEGSPAEVLLLARAEAGWGHWSAVRELLEDAEWLDTLQEAEGRWLLGRAHEAAGRWGAAADAYRTFSAGVRGDDSRRTPVFARLAWALANDDSVTEALGVLDEIPARDEVVRTWAAVKLARWASERGDTAALTGAIARVGAPEGRLASASLVPKARMTAGDTLGATLAYRALIDSLSGTGRGDARVELGHLALAGGDTLEARRILVAALDEASTGSAARAAATLTDLGEDDALRLLRLARMLDQSGDGRRALRAYDRVVAGDGASTLPETARLARARLMATVRSRQGEAIEEFRAIRATTRDPRIGARNLETWATVRARQGRSEHVRVLRRWLLEAYPESPEAIEVLWDRGDTAERRGDLAGATREFTTLIANAPTVARAGQARMRLGQIEMGRGRLSEAADVYEGYLEDFPNGRRWSEASYWAARCRSELGDTAAARALIRRIQMGEPVSYYAVLGAELFGETYEVHVPEGEAPEDVPWVAEELRLLDVLEDAGLVEGAEAQEARLARLAGGSRSAMLAVAGELSERGRTVAGINLGWALRREGEPWSRRLLRAVYPFPYREMVVREAAEWGVDPFLMAALIRQESAFKADAISRAGAVGLMQVMPPTGEQLARAHGPSEFMEGSLTTPEVNLHLGAAFFVEMNRRYGGNLPVVLSAYNAGPTRANRWRRYPEAADPVRFTERIPFPETRGYVKNVRRNRGIYEVLYGP